MIYLTIGRGDRHPSRVVVSSISEVQSIMANYRRTKADLYIDIKTKSSFVFNYLLKFIEDTTLNITFYIDDDGLIPDTFMSRINKVTKTFIEFQPRDRFDRVRLGSRDKEKLMDIVKP